MAATLERPSSENKQTTEAIRPLFLGQNGLSQQEVWPVMTDNATLEEIAVLMGRHNELRRIRLLDRKKRRL